MRSELARLEELANERALTEAEIEFVVRVVKPSGSCSPCVFVYLPSPCAHQDPLFAVLWLGDNEILSEDTTLMYVNR